VALGVARPANQPGFIRVNTTEFLGPLGALLGICVAILLFRLQRHRSVEVRLEYRHTPENGLAIHVRNKNKTNAIQVVDLDAIQGRLPGRRTVVAIPPVCTPALPVAVPGDSTTTLWVASRWLSGQPPTGAPAQINLNHVLKIRVRLGSRSVADSKWLKLNG